MHYALKLERDKLAQQTILTTTTWRMNSTMSIDINPCMSNWVKEFIQLYSTQTGGRSEYKSGPKILSVDHQQSDHNINFTFYKSQSQSPLDICLLCLLSWFPSWLFFLVGVIEAKIRCSHKNLIFLFFSRRNHNFVGAWYRHRKPPQQNLKNAESVDRTRDLKIFSLTLSQLSYFGF